MIRKFLTQVQVVCPCLFSGLPLLNPKLLFSGFPDRTSCPDTGGPTRVSNRTSVKCARRSSPAATTCPNTSKSTVFHESAGRFALQTDARGLGSPGNPAGATASLSRGRKPQEQEDVDMNVQVLPASGTSTGVRQPKHALSCRFSRLWLLTNLLPESKAAKLPS